MVVYKTRPNPAKWFVIVLLVLQDIAVYFVFNYTLTYERAWSFLGVVAFVVVTSLVCLLILVGGRGLRYELKDDSLNLFFALFANHQISLTEIEQIEKVPKVGYFRPRALGCVIMFLLKPGYLSALLRMGMIGKGYLPDSTEEIYCFCSS